MTIKELLALCRDNGYEGDASRASLQEWIEGDDCPIQLRDRKNKSISFDSLWPEKGTKGITITVGKNEMEPDTVEVVEDTPAEAPAEEPMAEETAVPKHRHDAKARTADPQAAHARKIEAAGTKAFSITRPEVSKYRQKIAQRGKAGGYKNVAQMLRNRAVFDDVDRAEYVGASLRLKMAPMIGAFDYAQKARDLDIVGKGASGTENALGGATFMGEFVPELIVLLNEYGAMRQLVDVKSPTGAPPYTYPRRTADPTVAWTSAGGQSSDQNPAYDNVSVNIGKLMGIMHVDNELLDDSAINIVDDLLGGFANGITYQEDLAYFLGDGTPTYGGFTGLLNAIGSAGTKTAATNSNLFSEIIDAELQAMFGLLPSYAWRGNVRITCSPQAFWNTFNRLAHAAGGITYLESQTGILRPAYNGIPVVFNDVTQATDADSTIFAFAGDFNAASKVVEIPGSLEFASSEHHRWDYDQLTLRARERIGMNVHDAGDSSNAGPVVAISTNAA